ncbi:MAG: ribulose-phosphate 3-epimerase [Leptospiraceae bacterium]|nr:ribulose-phosphate 3-epimerase [Leptospiraceae bacterium]
MKVSPSILAANIIDLKTALNQMDPSVVDLLHLDVMDGHFVPQLSFGEAIAASIADTCSIPLDVHLMVDQPEQEVPKYFALRPHNITFHIEATHNPIRLAQSIRAEGIRAGVSLNPGTPIAHLEPVLDAIDMVLVMSVEPGFYGQSFIESTYHRLDQLRDFIAERDIQIEVDGGITDANIAGLVERGLDICVAGSFCFKTGDVNGQVRRLKNAAGSRV